MATCTNCGANLTDTDQFCGVCGTPAAAADTATAVTVDVPEWLTADWGSAAKWAGSAALVAIVAHYAVLLVLYLGLNVTTGFDLRGMDWGDFLLIPVRMMLGMHGAVEGGGMWITAIAWIVGSLYVTYRVVRESLAQPSQENRWGSLALRAVKVGLVYAAIIIVALIAFDADRVNYQALFSPTGAADWNAAAGFFFTLLVVSLGAAYILFIKSRGPREAETPSVWSAGINGTLRILFIGIVGVFAFFLIAFLLEVISADGEFLKDVLGGLLIVLVALLAWAGIDIGLFFMMEAMKFFSGTLNPSEDVFSVYDRGESEPWFLVATMIVAAAFAIGGYTAARRTGSRELTPMLQAAGIAGGGVAVTYLVATAVLGDSLPGLSAGIGLSILWTALAVAGALLYAQSAGILQKININVQRSATPPAPAAGTCPSCGTPRTQEHAFCANCGTQF